MKRIGSKKNSAAKSQEASPAKDPSPEAKAYFESLEDPTVVERVRANIPNAHVFKLPPRPGAGGWRGADWRDSDKIWIGTLRVVDRVDVTAIVLLDTKKQSSTSASQVFAVCPYREGAVDRCVDSSRYFVLRVENRTGQHMFVGLAFNDRNSSFDFNTALQDSVKEREAESHPPPFLASPKQGTNVDYSLKQGQKIHVNLSKLKLNDDDRDDKQGTDAKMKSLEESNAAPTQVLGLKKILGKPNSSHAAKIVKSKQPKKKSPTNTALAPPANDSKQGRIKTSGNTLTTEAIDMFGSINDDGVDFDTADAFDAFPTNAL